MIARTAELMGADHIGIGSDTGRGWPDSMLDWMRNGRWTYATAKPRWPEWPDWYRNPADFGNLTAGLLARRLSSKDVAKIMGGNWSRFMGEGIVPAAGPLA
jgi:membrane dipeptidase